jgi:hypothetical protein
MKLWMLPASFWSLALLIFPSSGSKNKQFKTPVDFQQTVQRYIPEDRTLNNYYCKNMKSYIILLFAAVGVHTHELDFKSYTFNMYVI